MDRECLGRPNPRMLRIAPLLVVGLALALAACGRENPPQSPPRPTAMNAADLTNAHYQLPARPTPPSPGMM